jgi:hypothetical protein
MQIGFAMPPEPLWYISIQATEQYLAAMRFQIAVNGGIGPKPNPTG